MQKIKLILSIIYTILVLIIGGSIYYLYENLYITLGKPEPTEVLCIKGKAFKQVDPKSTVYIKTDRECYSKEKKVIYAL